MADFSFKNDLKYVEWKSTLLVGLYRSVSAGVVLAIMMLFSGDAGVTPTTIISAPLVWPVGYFVIFLPVGLITGQLSKVGVPYIGLLSVIFSAFIVIGDPLLWGINKAMSGKLLPAESFNFFNFTVILFIVDEERRNAALA